MLLLPWWPPLLLPHPLPHPAPAPAPQEAIDGCRKTASDKVRPDIEALAKKYGDGGALPEAAKEALEGKFMTSLRPCVEKQVAELKKLPTTIRLS